MKRRIDLTACLAIPKKWNLEAAEEPQLSKEPENYNWSIDPLIFHLSLLLREFLSTMLLLLLNSRLGGSLFIAAPIVTFYINIVFRRPLNNPFVLMFACCSAGDWKRANVAGYPGYNRDSTSFCELLIYCIFMTGSQLSGASAAAYVKASYAMSIGSEALQTSAWGINQLNIKVAENSTYSCWKNNTPPIPVRLFGDKTKDYLLDSCTATIQGQWWFLEDMCAVIFLIVSYMHIWKWLRWDDEEDGNAACTESRYWGKIVSFSVVTGALNLATTMTFPSAHAGLHTSLYIFLYQTQRSDLYITTNNMYEPLIRGGGGIVGCGLAILYEQILARYFDNKRNWLDVLAYKMLYQNANMQIIDPKKK